jgi:hypothetical protein
MNFDNIYNAMVTLFVLSTLEGWPDYMFQLIDGAPETSGPIFNNNEWVNIMIMFFIFIGSFFSVNLFIAITS